MDINLLPIDQVEKIKETGIAEKMLLVITAIFIVNLSVLGYLFYFNYVFKNELVIIEGKTLNSDIENKAKELDFFEKEVKEIHNLTNKAVKYNKENLETIPWSGLLTELNQLSTPGIQVEGVELMADEENKIKISGVAHDRELVLGFRKNLEKSSNYSEIISPLSNLTSREDINFEFVLTLKDESQDKK